jgi:hypothetical protein
MNLPSFPNRDLFYTLHALPRATDAMAHDGGPVAAAKDIIKQLQNIIKQLNNYTPCLPGTCNVRLTQAYTKSLISFLVEE